MKKEIEIKFRLDDKEAMRKKLLETGFISEGRHLQINCKFNDKDGTLGPGSGRLLRIRKDRKNILTYKGDKQVINNMKILTEIETEVSDAENTEVILNRLGYHVDEVMEKYREAFQKGNIEVVIDEVPFLGDIMEIEGPQGDIEKTAKDLGLSIGQGISSSYGSLWKRYREENGLYVRDATFEEEKKHG